MNVRDFLSFDDGTDKRYELVGGKPVAMSPPSAPHGEIVANLTISLGNQLKNPCRIVAEAGIFRSESDDTYYQADLVVTCTERAEGETMTPAPQVVIEVLSPSTSARDRGEKVPFYRSIASVSEIMLVSSMARTVELWHRSGEEWIVIDIIGDEAAVQLPSLGVRVPLSDICRGVALDTSES